VTGAKERGPWAWRGGGGLSNPDRNGGAVAIGLILFAAALASALVLLFLVARAARKERADE